ncbi:MAG TPA: ABC transporter permease [Vicinamibacterales bacterium]|nr:ABC transporter permease [Vicinamibacterales bacterium]
MNWLYAARGLRRTPAFTLAAVASLSVGLALAASAVSVVNAYLIRSLPYRDAGRIYHLRYAPPGPWEPRGMTALDWTAVADVVEHPIASAGETFHVSDGGFSTSLRALRVTHGFVEGLGVRVVSGRTLQPHDFAAGGEPAALIGHALWRERFGADPGAIGRVILAEAESRPGAPETFRIAGVLEPDFYYGREARTGVDLLVTQAAPIRAYMVKLRQGVLPAVAERRITDAARAAATSPIPAGWTGVQLESAHERWVGSVRPVLLGVVIAVALVLVIVCANVAVLMLLRAMQRRREVAVRLALGAGWTQIARMLMAETALLSGAGLAGGLGLTALSLGTLAPLIETQLGRQAPNAAGIQIDATVLLAVAAAGLLAAVAISLAPLASSLVPGGRALTDALRQSGRGVSGGRPMRRLRGGLIAFEVAGSLVLLVACGLMVRSLIAMVSTDLGFDPDGLVRSRVVLRARNHPDPASYLAFKAEFERRVTEATGAVTAYSSWPPYVAPPDRLVEADGAGTAMGGTVFVSSGYFSAFAIALQQGRPFSADEVSAAAPLAIVSASLAQRLWPDGTAVGRRLRFVDQTPSGPRSTEWRTVVGVARDVRQAYGDEAKGDLYMPRLPEGRFGTFYVRTGAATPALFEALRKAAADLDRDAVVDPPRLVSAEDRTLAGTRFLTMMLTSFAAIAAFLALLGIYGVTAYAVQQRHKEVAVRVALGATARNVLAMFLREGVRLLAIGAVAGLAGGVLVSRVLQSRIFGIVAFDPLTYGTASVLLIGAGLATTLWASRGATRTNPSAALNAD